jgi:GTPase SAR1 family protein
MGGKGSKTIESHHYHTEYVQDPETVARMNRYEEEIANLTREAMAMKDPSHFNNNVSKIFDHFIAHVSELKLVDVIDKKPGEVHIGFIGPVTAGKSTMCNTIYGTKEPVALGHCTAECKVVHTTAANRIIWDMFGADNDFKYYDPSTLSFIKNLDYCIVLFDSDISTVSWILRTVYAINPKSLIVVRTKVDQCSSDSERTVEDEKLLDIKKVSNLLESDDIPVFAVSSHNIAFSRGERYDWDELTSILNPTSVAS